jgi:hypothetical protein
LYYPDSVIKSPLQEKINTEILTGEAVFILNGLVLKGERITATLIFMFTSAARNREPTPILGPIMYKPGLN